MRTSTWSRLTRRSAFWGAFSGFDFIVELDDLDLAAAELAALLRDQQFDGERDVLAEFGEGARVRQHQSELERLRLGDRPSGRDGGCGGGGGRALQQATACRTDGADGHGACSLPVGPDAVPRRHVSRPSIARLDQRRSNSRPCRGGFNLPGAVAGRSGGFGRDLHPAPAQSFAGRGDPARPFAEMSRQIDRCAFADLLAMTLQPFAGFRCAGDEQVRDHGSIGLDLALGGQHRGVVARFDEVKAMAREALRLGAGAPPPARAHGARRLDTCRRPGAAAG